MKLSWRIWVLIAVLILSLWAINPRPWHEGVVVTSVQPGGPAELAGMQGPQANEQPVLRERVLKVGEIDTLTEPAFLEALQVLEPGGPVRVLTSKESYILNIPSYNESNATFNPVDAIGFSVDEVPTNNVRKGLDLTGGVRVLLQPSEHIDDDTMTLLIDNIEERLNVFGLSDVVVRPTQDFSGNQYVLAEVAGANEQSVIDLLTNQGEFAARIGNQTIFSGGQDITYVGTSAQDAGIQQCAPSGTQYLCTFFFSISLSPEAAQRHADVTATLPVTGQYLSEPLDLYLDGTNISSLNIGASLKGRAETQIQISGSGSGSTEQIAFDNALDEMKQLQALLATGSLPVELSIVKTDNISPVLGASFIRNIWLVGVAALLAVIVVVVSRYRDWRISIPMIVAMLSEVVIILGVAALTGWNLDLAAIAGIVIAIGTGVDDQIIIVDEIKSGKERRETWKMRMKKAFFIIFAAFFTLVAAMLPLIWAGAGLVRGFAITTVIGVTVGVLVTRPAFASIAEIILHD